MVGLRKIGLEQRTVLDLLYQEDREANVRDSAESSVNEKNAEFRNWNNRFEATSNVTRGLVQVSSPVPQRVLLEYLEVQCLVVS